MHSRPRRPPVHHCDHRPVVGENGAGKTTLIKLLAKMYEPDSGSITVDGVPLAEIETAAWRARLAGSFQDFHRFEFRP